MSVNLGLTKIIWNWLITAFRGTKNNQGCRIKVAFSEPEYARKGQKGLT